MRVDVISGSIIADAIAVHRELGPGLLESTYEVCLCLLLRRRGLLVERQVSLPIEFGGERLECGYRLDILVDKLVVVEVKTVARIEPVHCSQVMTYLKFSGCSVGLLINFNVSRLTDGLRRIVHNYPGAFSAPSHPSAPLRD